MVNNNYNVIKPVDNLKNIGRLNPAKRRRERKKKQDMQQEDDSQNETANNPEGDSIEEGISGEIAENDRDERSIDYRA
jgi:hypothetical protein